jgi:hypothetical protein
MSGSSVPRYPLQTPNQIRANLSAIVKIFSDEPGSPRRLVGYDAKSRALGDPIAARFADTRIVPIRAAGVRRRPRQEHPPQGQSRATRRAVRGLRRDRRLLNVVSASSE